MKTERKIFKNTFLLSAGKGFGDVCTFILLAYFGRTFGAEMLGKYSFAMAIGGLLTVFASLGFNSLIIREVSKDESKSIKYIGNLIVVRGSLSILIWILIGIGTYYSNLFQDTKLILLIISGYHIFYRLTGLLRASFKAHDQMHYSAILESYHKVFILFFGVACILLFRDPVITLAAYPFGALTMLIFALLIYKNRFGWPEFRLDYAFTKDCILKAVPFFFIIIIGQLYDRIGIVLLTHLKGEASTGIFSASDRLLVTLYAGISIFTGVLFPYMSRFSAQSKDQLYKLCERAMRFIYVVLLSLSIVVFILSEKIILLSFGKNYLESIQVLQLLVWSLLFMGLNQIISRLLIVTYQEKKLLKIRVIAYIGYCAACLLLIWKFSYIGLAWGKILTEAALFFITIFYAFNLQGVFNLMKQMLGPLTSCLVSLLLFYFIKDMTVWFALPAVLGTYVSAMFLTKSVFLHDLKYLRNIILGSN